MTERFRIGDVVFNAETGEIESAGGVQRLQPQPALVLAVLVRRANTLVTRQELRAIVWPGTVSDTDDGLNYCIRQIRAALGDGASGSRYIETLPRRGYRFVAPVTREGAAATPVDDVPRQRPSRERRLSRLGIALGIAVVVSGGAALALVRRDARPVPTLSVAVLPLSTPNATAWANGINDAITERLVELLTNAPSPRGRVVGPVTTRAYVNDSRPHTELGAMLGVEYVISGGVRERDSTIFIQAVRSRDGVHVLAWRVPVGGRAIEAVVEDLTRALEDRARTW